MKTLKYALVAFLIVGAAGSQASGKRGSPAPRPKAVAMQEMPDSVRQVVARSRITGETPPSQKIYLAVSLRPAHLPELEAFCNAVSSPLSLTFHKFITPEEVGERFGASQSDVDAVVGYLKSQGMKIDLVAKNRMAVLAYATVAQTEKAFSTDIKNLRGPDPRGKTITFRANTLPLEVPSYLFDVILDIQGCEDYTRPERRTTLNPTQTRTLYKTATMYGMGFTGAGRKIGISNWDGYRLTNIPLYVAAYGLPIPGGGVGSNIHKVPIGGRNGEIVGTIGEGDLDIQMELGMAPLADIYIYDNAGAGDLIGVLTKEAQDNFDILSESWGWNLTPNPALATAAHNQHLAMTAQGMTYMAASGDNGTALEPYSYPDYDPEVLLIGGTVATTDGAGNRSSEVGWSGSGGGWSTFAASFNVLPSWQVGTGVPTNINKRLVPDISLHASGNTAGSAGAYLFYYNGGLSTGIGTSFSSPVCTGSLALVEQRLASFGLPSRLGRVQDVIYSQNGRTDVWFDITSGGNGNLPNPPGGASVCTAKWDFVTGWGAPDFEMFFHSIALVLNKPNAMNVFRGQLISGNPASLGDSDNNRVVIRTGPVLNQSESPVDLMFSGVTLVPNPFAFTFRMETNADTAGVAQTLSLFNYVTNAWEAVDTRNAPLADTTFDVTLSGNLARFVGGAGVIQGRIAFKQVGPISHFPWIASIDVANWRFTP